MNFNKKYKLVGYEFKNSPAPLKITANFTALSLGSPHETELRYVIEYSFLFDTSTGTSLPIETDVVLLGASVNSYWGTGTEEGRQAKVRGSSKILNIEEVYKIKKEQAKEIVKEIQAALDKFKMLELDAEKPASSRLYFKDADGNICTKEEFLSEEPFVVIPGKVFDFRKYREALEELQKINKDKIRMMIYAGDASYLPADLTSDILEVKLYINEFGHFKFSGSYGKEIPDKKELVKQLFELLQKRIDDQQKAVDALSATYVEMEKTTLIKN